MDLKKIFNKYFKNLNTKKTITNLIIILLVGVLLILVGDITQTLRNGEKKKNDASLIEVSTNAVSSSIQSSYEERIKKDLQDTLGLISGVGRISVMVYFEGGSETIPAVNINDSNKKTEERDNQGGTRVITENTQNRSMVIVNEGTGSKPFIVKQVNPVIGGVIVIAEGGDNPDIKEKLQTAVKTVLNLPQHKVAVFSMKRN